MAFKITDSTNQEVGKFVSLTTINTALVEFKVAGKIYRVPVSNNSIGEMDHFDLVYPTTDCSGQAYIVYDPSVFIYGLWKSTQLGWLSSYPQGVVPQTITVLSYNSTDDSAPNVSEPYTALVVSAIIGPDLAYGFAAPFKFI